ncbi:MAG: FxsA family protein [Pseudomonadota bacterium]
MFKLLFALFILIPLIEISLIIQVGQIIGAFHTIVLIVFTAVVGAGLLKIQGTSTLSRVQQQLEQGQLPAQELIEGVMLLLAGALLLTPGFFTDVIGFLILTPHIRSLFAVNLLKYILVDRVNRYKSEDGTVIEGEYHEVRHHSHLKNDE